MFKSQRSRLSPPFMSRDGSLGAEMFEEYSSQTEVLPDSILSAMIT